MINLSNKVKIKTLLISNEQNYPKNSISNKIKAFN